MIYEEALAFNIVSLVWTFFFFFFLPNAKIQGLPPEIQRKNLRIGSVVSRLTLDRLGCRTRTDGPNCSSGPLRCRQLPFNMIS